MKKILLTLTLFIFTFSFAHAREGNSISLLGVGNFFLTDSHPDLKIGPGGGLGIDFRFNQHWALNGDFFFSMHDGSGLSAADDSVWLLGIPSINMKFYPMAEESSIEPYISAGLGVYIVTEGDVSDNSGGVGVGAQLGIGADFYVTEKISLGLAAQFRSIGLIQGNSQSEALINFSMLGNVAFHF